MKISIRMTYEMFRWMSVGKAIAWVETVWQTLPSISLFAGSNPVNHYAVDWLDSSDLVFVRWRSYCVTFHIDPELKYDGEKLVFWQGNVMVLVCGLDVSALRKLNACMAERSKWFTMQDGKWIYGGCTMSAEHGLNVQTLVAMSILKIIICCFLMCNHYVMFIVLLIMRLTGRGSFSQMASYC